MSTALFEFLSQCLGGHAALIADTPGVEDNGFEVWRQLHAQYSPVGANYETDMLQAFMVRAQAKGMASLADSVVQFEHDWRKYEQETGDKFPEKVKSAALLKMFPKTAQTDELKWK